MFARGSRREDDCSIFTTSLVIFGHALYLSLSHSSLRTQTAMANILRSAKSANEWGNNELEAYNIVIQNAPVPAFFATQNLPPSPIAGTTVWNVERETPDTELSELESDFFFYMKAVEETESLESAVDDFAYFLLRMLGFTSKSRKIRQRPPMHFVMCGKRVDACADVTLVDGKSYLLLVQEDKVGFLHSMLDEKLLIDPLAPSLIGESRRSAHC